MASPIGRLPTAEPIESKLVNMLWPNDNIVAAPVNRKWQKCRSACQRLKGTFTLVIALAWPWYSFHSPGCVRGNFIARSVPALVPVNSILPECDIATVVNVTSPDSTLRRIYKEHNVTMLSLINPTNIYNTTLEVSIGHIQSNSCKDFHSKVYEPIHFLKIWTTQIRWLATGVFFFFLQNITY